MNFLRLAIFIAHAMHIISMYPNIKYYENICNRLRDIQKKNKKKNKKTEVPKCQMLAANIFKAIYTHGNKLGNACNNVTTNFGLYISFFVKHMNNVFYNLPESVVSKVASM